MEAGEVAMQKLIQQMPTLIAEHIAKAKQEKQAAILKAEQEKQAILKAEQEKQAILKAEQEKQ